MSRIWEQISHLSKKALGISLLVIAFSLPAKAQGAFQSGSTGADGAFNPTTNQTIAVPESGIFNFTTITIPSGITVTFTPNSKNTPLTILATGDVLISGAVDVSGKVGGGGIGSGNGAGGNAGPGGFPGGNAGYAVADLFNAMNGSGPGGGIGGTGSPTNANAGAGGSYASLGVFNLTNTTYGSGLLQPLVGGSGGGGGGASGVSLGAGGGGGGGAIVIASSTIITINSTGLINAKGGNGGGLGPGNGSAPGGGGAGGAIRLIANTLSGNGTLSVAGGAAGQMSLTEFRGGAGGVGYIRAQATNVTNFNPSTPSTVASIGSPTEVVIANSPQLTIVSVGGINAPASPLGSLRGISDVVIPSTQPNPMTVVLEGRNIPVSTSVTIRVVPAFATPLTPIPTLLSATATPGITSANLSINLPIGTSLISAIATIDVNLARLEPMFIDGERVDKIEVATSFGKDSQTTYITSSGKKIIR